MLYSFANCELDTDRVILRRAGQPIEIQRRVFQVLTYLLEHYGHIVSRDELAEQVWQATIANATVDACIKEVRQAVGDNGRDQRIIATRHGFGYEFVAPVVGRSREPVETRPPGVSPPVPGLAPGSVSAAPDADTFTATLSQPPGTPEVFTAEKKIVTILCCGIQAPPAPRAGTDLDRLHNQVRALYHLVRQAVGQYGGTLQPITGHRFLAVFGAPVAQEDHAQRAVLAALGVHHQLSTPTPSPLASLTESLAVRLGLHTGEVAVGGFAEDQALTAAVGGETALLATALQDAADSGTMLCSAATARLIQGMADLEPVQPVLLAGQSAPIRVYKVLRQQVPQTTGALRRIRPLRRFVGRRQELATLRQRLEQVEAGHGQVVGIAGELGIGKSRLLNEFRQRLAGRPITYLEGRCLSYSQETPYRPVLDVLRHACDLTDLDPPDVTERQVRHYLQELGIVSEDSAPYLLHLLGVPAGTERLPALPSQELKVRIHATFRRLAGYASQQQPLVIAIEDLHWIDATSDELLTTLVEHIAGVPILLLTTYRHGYRPPWQDKSYATQMTLQPLTPHDSRHLVQEVFSAVEVPEDLVQRLLEQAEGNPFFLEELAWTVMEHGASSPSVEVPDTVQATLMARIDRLPPTQKHLLQVAAVIGKDVPLAVLDAVAELPVETLHAGLDRLQGAEFLYESRLVPAPVHTFKHALTQEVAYQSLLRSTRQPYHQRIAQVLAEQFPDMVRLYPERLAHHYTEAGLGERAIPYWQKAGQQAAARSANTEAIHHLTQGLVLLRTLPNTPERDRQEIILQTTLGSVLIAAKGYAAPEVEETFSRAQVLCQRIGDTRQRVLVLRGLWSFYLLRAQYETARQVGEQLLALAEREQNPEYLLEAHLALGIIVLFLGEFLLSRTHLERGIALYGMQQPKVPISHDAVPVDITESRSGQIVVACFAYAARVLWFLGYPDQALQRSHEGVMLVQRLSVPLYMAQALGMHAILHQVRREIQMTHEWSEKTMAYATEQGIPYWSAFAALVRGWALTAQGQKEGGIAQIHQGLATYQTTGARLGGTWFRLLLAEAHGKNGQVEEGLQVLAEALRLVDNTQERYYEAEIHRVKGELLLMQGGAETAANACFRQALEVAHRQSAKAWELRAATSLARLWSVQGKRADARELLAPICSWFTEGFETADLQDARRLLENLTVSSA